MAVKTEQENPRRQALIATSQGLAALAPVGRRLAGGSPVLCYRHARGAVGVLYEERDSAPPAERAALLAFGA